MSSRANGKPREDKQVCKADVISRQMCDFTLALCVKRCLSARAGLCSAGEDLSSREERRHSPTPQSSIINQSRAQTNSSRASIIHSGNGLSIIHYSANGGGTVPLRALILINRHLCVSLTVSLTGTIHPSITLATCTSLSLE